MNNERLPTSSRVTTLPHLPALDGARVVAIGVVLGLHSHLPLFRGGYLGVDIFFCLSGFLITTIVCAEHNRNSGVSLTAFYRNRALRLLPALGAVLAVAMVFNTTYLPSGGAGSRLEVLAAALTYTANWFQALGRVQMFGVLQHTWTLSIEEQFYILWPVILVFALSRTRSRSHIVVGLVAAAAVSMVLMSTQWRQSANPPVYYRTDTRAGALLLGCALALVFTEHPALSRGAALGVRFGSALALAVLLPMLALMDVGHRHEAFAFRVGIPASWLLIAAVVGVLVWCPPVLVVRLCRTWVVRRVAQISYGLYLWHPLIFDRVDHWVTPHHHGVYIRAAIAIPIAVVIADLSYRLVESPFLQLKQRWQPRLYPVHEVPEA